MSTGDRHPKPDDLLCAGRPFADQDAIDLVRLIKNKTGVTVKCGISRDLLDAFFTPAYDRGITEGLRRADNAINWQTSCLGCADRLDGLIAERSAGYEEGLTEGRRQAAEEIAEKIRTAAGLAWKSHWTGLNVAATIAENLDTLGKPAEQPEPRHESFTTLVCDKVEGPHPKHTWSHRDEPCEGHVCPGVPVEWPAEQPDPEDDELEREERAALTAMQTYDAAERNEPIGQPEGSDRDA